MSSTTTTTYGVSTSSLLGILFIALKLTGYIDWSWLWVLAPFWIPVAFFAVLGVVCLVALLILDD